MCWVRRLTRPEADLLAVWIRVRGKVVGSVRTAPAERRMEMRWVRRGMGSEVQERKMWVRVESGHWSGEA